MMRSIVKWALLCVVLALITAGGIILMLTPHYDPTRASLTWLYLGMSVLCFGLGVWLGLALDKRKMLPQ